MLTLTRTDKEAITELLSYAGKNRISKEQAMKIFRKEALPPGDNCRYACTLRAGKRTYRVVFTYEEHELWMRHLSVSSADKKTMTLEDVNAILRAFQFSAQLTALEEQSVEWAVSWWEGERHALNVLEFANPDEASKAGRSGMTLWERVSPRVLIGRTPPAAEVPQHG